MKAKFEFEPLRWLLHPVALLACAAAAQAWIDGATVRGIVTALLGVMIAAATETARSRVAPVPGPQRRSSWGKRGQAGYSAIELLVGLIVFLVLVAVLVWVLRLLFGAL